MAIRRLLLFTEITSLQYEHHTKDIKYSEKIKVFLNCNAGDTTQESPRFKELNTHVAEL